MNATPASLLDAMKNASTRAAGALGEILGCPVNIFLDDIRNLDYAEYLQFIQTEIDSTGTIIYIRFSGELSGSAYFLVLGDNSQKIIQILADQDPGLLNDVEDMSAALVEIGNIVLNMYAGTVLNQLGVRVVYQTPQILIEKANFDNRLLLEEAQNQKFQILTSRLAISGKEVVVYILLSLYQ